MGDLALKISPVFIIKFASYTILLGQPSTGKSQALKAFSTAAYSIENCSGISNTSSNLANSVTVEAVVEMLKNNKSILSFWDEGIF